MAFQQSLNLISQILKQTVGLQHIFRENFILRNKPISQVFGDTTILRVTSVMLLDIPQLSPSGSSRYQT